MTQLVFLDQESITVDKGTVEPFTNHFMDGFKDVGRQESHIPITADDFMPRKMFKE